MEKIKIASRFLTKSQASKQATKERQLLKVQGKHKTHKVEVLFAYNFWRTNKWFNQKKFGLPNPTDQDYIIIIAEISKPNTINMPATTQKQSRKDVRTISKHSRAQKSQWRKVSTINVHRTNKPTPILNNDTSASIYSLFRIPYPYFYHSVA